MKLLIAFSAICFSLVYGFDRTIIAPKAFRVGAPENVILNLHGYRQATISAYLQDVPNRQNTFSSTTNRVVSGADINSPIVLQMQVESQDIAVFRNRQYVALIIQVRNSGSAAGDFTSTTEVLVTKEAGYLFVRTNRPIYRPSEKVLIHVAPLGQRMAADSQTRVSVTVKTPDGIGISRTNSRLPENNFLEVQFDIPELPEIGIWSVEAAYSSNGFETKSEAKFRIDRYVLPTFNVRIALNQPFLLTSDDGIFGRLLANYSYGEPVDGSYYIRLLLKRTPDSAPAQIFQSPGRFFTTNRIQNGKADIEILIQDIEEGLEEGETLQALLANKASLILQAVVNANSQGTPLEATSSPELPFLSSPFIIDTSRTSLYFTPGLVYLIRIDILKAVSRKPNPDVPVNLTVVDGGVRATHQTTTNNRGEIDFQLNLRGNTQKTITVKTNSGDYPAAAQTSATFILVPYISPSKQYLQITSQASVGSVGQRFFITFSFSQRPAEIRYSVVSRGAIVYSATNRPPAGSSQSSENFPISQDMVPNARIVAYYISGNEAVSNSFWFDVENQCKTELTVNVPKQVIPGETVNFEVQGEPNALVGVSAVDRAAYFLFNKTRITKDTMFDSMESYDQGCVRNGGSDTRNVYINAGLVISSDAADLNISPSLISSLNCPPSSRKKREINEENERQRKKRQAAVARQSVIDAMLHICERDGRLPSPTGESCPNRARRVGAEFEREYRGCRVRFRNACFEAESQRKRNDLLRRLGRSGGRTSTDQAAEEIALAQPRIDFRESLIFTTRKLNSFGRLSPLDAISASAADSITTFEVDAISMASIPNGFCVSDTKNLRIFKDIFVQIFLPYSIRLREQAILRMALFNYNPSEPHRNLTIRVSTDDALCSKYQTDINSDSAVLVRDVQINSEAELGFSFAVFPIKIPVDGLSKITVRVTELQRGSRTVVLDEIQKNLRIEESGVLKETYQSFALDVSNGKPQKISFGFGFPEQYIPGTRQCSIFGYTNFLGPTIEVDPTSGEPRNVESVFRMPRGCGEQTMIFCGPNIYGHMYLQASGRLTPQVQPNYRASIARMETCYTRQLRWRSQRTDPPLQAFAVWDRSPPNLWLNAFTVKVFARAKQFYTDLDVAPLCSALNWIIGEQHSTGYFNEKYRTHHREMKGAVQGERTLAAYTLVSLEESASICPGQKAQIDASTRLAMTYLVNNKNHATFQGRPYSLALLAYAFALDNPTDRNTVEINNRLLALRQTTADNRQVFWTVRRGSIAGTDLNPYWYKRPQAIDVEATAYALLAQVTIAQSKPASQIQQAELDLTRKIVHWLIAQRNDGGAFISTQDTVIALQALATYEVWINSINLQSIPTRMNISIQGASTSAWKAGSEQKFTLDEANQALKHTVEVPSSVINGLGVNVSVSGHGEGVLSYRCTYKTLANEEGCHFVMAPKVTLKFDNIDDPEARKVYTLEVKIAKSKGEQSEQAIVEIGLLTGFVPDEQSVAAITVANRVDGVAQRYDITEQNVVLYFNEIKADGVTITIDLIQILENILPQPAEIRVLDYYEPFIQCATFYSLPSGLPFLRTTNCDDDDNALCSCAEGGCATCRVRSAQLDNTVCLDGSRNCATCETGDCENMFTKTCRRNYAYVVNVTNVNNDGGNVFVSFAATVLQILKVGDDASVQRNSQEKFMIRSDCYTGCTDSALTGDNKILTPGRELFVAGNKIDVSLDRNNNEIHLYDLASSAILERKIPDSTCARRRKSYNDRKCDSVLSENSNASQKNKDRCKRFSKFVQACDNFNSLVQRLNDGCD